MVTHPRMGSRCMLPRSMATMSMGTRFMAMAMGVDTAPVEIVCNVDR